MARRRLPKGIFEHLDKGTEDGIALRENRAAFDRRRLRSRYLIDLSDRDWSIQIFGEPIGFPIGIAPTGTAGLMWHRGELALARAAAKSGVPFTLSVGSLTAMEDIARVGGRLWFQLYMWKESDLTDAIVARAESLGFEALVVTIDAGLGRLREHNERNGFSFPFRPNSRALLGMARHPRWLTNVLLRTLLTDGALKNENYPPQYQRMVAFGNSPKPQAYTGTFTWRDVARLREAWPRRLIIKSVVHPDDARLAVERGADAVVVSNHGGRVMDSALASIDALPDVVEAVGSTATVILDSGIRRGSDIVKALALGAQMVLVGRAPLYGLAAGGQLGVVKAIETLRTEFEKTMGALGCRCVAELGPEIFA